MNKLKFLFSRIIKMNYKSFFQTIKSVSKKTNKAYLIILIDIVYCGFRYQAGYRDYELYEMYLLNSKQRKTVLTRGINNSIIKKYNNKKYIDIFDSKLNFNKKFNKYLGRKWIAINGKNFKEFKEFINTKTKIIVKPLSECCGRGVEIINPEENDPKELYQKLQSTGQILVEEVATQLPELSKLHASSINTIRVVTLKQKVVIAFLRIGNNNNVVDNFNHQGLVAPINISTGIIDFLAVDKKGNKFEKHPLTKEQIIWFKIPKWTRIRTFCEEVSKVVPEVGYVGWDISINENGPFLIEANNIPGHDLYQLPPHRINGQGVLPIFKKVMEENKK